MHKRCLNLPTSGNNLSGIASQFATQNGQIATQIQNCVADFVHTALGILMILLKRSPKSSKLLRKF